MLHNKGSLSPIWVWGFPTLFKLSEIFLPALRADKEPQAFFVRTGPWDLAKSYDREKITYQTKKESEEEKKHSVCSEHGMDTDRDTGDVNDAVSLSGKKQFLKFFKVSYNRLWNSRWLFAINYKMKANVWDVSRGTAYALWTSLTRRSGTARDIIQCRTYWQPH